MSATVAVVGSLHLDLMVDAPGLPRLGETMVGRAWAMKCGGKGGNQAVAAARHGARSAMVGVVGDDDFGRRLRANLVANGVDATGVAVRRDAGSGMSVAVSEPGGDYAAIIVSGVNLLLDTATIEQARAVIAGARWLLLQNEIPAEANLAAARLAREAGCRVILNAAPARTHPADLAALVDILVVNALEASDLCGASVTDLATATGAARQLAASAGSVVVTVGGDGVAAALAGGEIATLAPHRVAVCSTHGAGDMFVGALAAKLADGDTPRVALDYANAAAAALVAMPEAARDATDIAQAARALLRG